jgi:hypothetical protein
MSGNSKNQAQKRGCDTPYRARSFDTHLTHVCIKLFCGFHGGRCARALFPGLGTPSIQPFDERVNGALREMGA